jgi:hypothetical protein
MKRITMILIATLALALLVYAQSRTTVQTIGSKQAAQPASGNVLTPAMRDEYKQLVKSKAGESAVRAWAGKHKLEIVSLKGYDIKVIPEQPQVNQLEAAQACDAKKCPIAEGSLEVHNRLGVYLGTQFITCKAGSCTWVRDPKTGRFKRICGNWRCENGLLYPP